MQKFSEIEYKRPDIAGAGKAAEAILEKFSAAATAASSAKHAKITKLSRFALLPLPIR